MMVMVTVGGGGGSGGDADGDGGEEFPNSIYIYTPNSSGFGPDT